MTDADKQQYQVQADRARVQYDKDMKVYKDKVAKAEVAQANDKGDSLLGKKKQKESAKPSKVEKEVAAKAGPAGKAKVDDKKAKTGKAAAPAKAAKQTRPKKVAGGEENAEEKKAAV